ncbi:NAD(P) transhydrogenase subunit alpha [Parvularcula sp. ZS-1/3]|uniref:proton-translocating NAD(P)(+) transhydrogenase n=1 Tax=Parvularcula mediterranea TaxID=2732508 RepID=A0A7Y3RM96_9PROT|nr:NAD(P) transhydrogenase subunit alpha [Parvularcula mediterranea]NNU16200.1 NAD(P) transhydrogenase subunit alpha [Parvularcula mediterranea]
MKLAGVRTAGERRSPLTPETIKKLKALGYEVAVETGLGKDAGILDSAYEEAGASVSGEPANGADVVLAAGPLEGEELGKLARGTRLVGMLDPYDAPERLAAYANAGVDAFSMELVPRITRAQAMDVLSSQANLAGYKAVIDASAHYSRAFPMMMTAAGTVPPAKVFVMGAGVAGLQAIATAKRLGAVVSATDVRAAAGEQVKSLGGSFVFVKEAMEEGEGTGGYAKELTAEQQKAQAELVAEHIKKMDVVITTALIPGRPAPKLVSAEMLGSMKPGSVVVDLAAPRGGNVDGEADGVTVLRPKSILDGLAGEASNLLAKNFLSFVTLITDKEAGQVKVDPEDEIIKGIQLTRDGDVVHERFLKA